MAIHGIGVEQNLQVLVQHAKEQHLSFSAATRAAEALNLNNLNGIFSSILWMHKTMQPCSILFVSCTVLESQGLSYQNSGS